MSSPAKKKVVVAMSGGVDSSVAAALLLRQGYEVIGVFMRLGTPPGVEAEGEAEDKGTRGQGDKERGGGTEARRHEGPEGERAGDCQLSTDKGQLTEDQGQRTTDQSAIGNRQSAMSKQGCCSVLDAADARRVAHMLGIPFYVLNFQDDFGRVIDYFVREYNLGRTPNPCVRCNDWLKFGKLARYAQAVGADYVASGHYARIGTDPATGEKVLMRGRDHRKDQSYVLFGMSRETLDHTLLPIGDYEKHEVRKIAEELDLPVFNKPDSQEICFVPDQNYPGLVQRRTPEAFSEGDLVTREGEVVGKHPGHQHFTIGQRKGVGVAFGRPIYVVEIDAAANRVVLGEKEDLLKRTLWASQVNVLSSRLSREDETGIPGMPGVPIRCQAKIRYNHAPQPAVACLVSPDQLKVTFDVPQSAITPGQAVVLFDGEIVLGGGWIDRAE